MSSLGMFALFSGSIMPQPETIPEEGQAQQQPQEQQQQQQQSAAIPIGTPVAANADGRRTPLINRSISHSPNFYSALPSPRDIARYVFGYRPTLKTKRSLAEEAECGDEVSAVSYTHLTLPTICSV